MTAIEIFNVCTHGKDGGGGLSMAIPTPCSISAHLTNAKRFATGGGDANVFVTSAHSISAIPFAKTAPILWRSPNLN